MTILNMIVLGYESSGDFFLYSFIPAPPPLPTLNKSCINEVILKSNEWKKKYTVCVENTLSQEAHYEGEN